MITKQAQFDLSTRNTFRMKVSCALYVEVTEEEDLLAIDWASLPQPVFVMGGGSNLLFTGDFPGTVLHVAICADFSTNSSAKLDQVQGQAAKLDQVQDQAAKLDQVQGVFGRGQILGGGPGPASVPQNAVECGIGGPGPRGEIGPSPKIGWTRSTSSCEPPSAAQSSAQTSSVSEPSSAAQSSAVADPSSAGQSSDVADPNISPDCPDNADVLVTVPAGTVFDDFCAWAASEGLWGPENLSLIPGECGASAVQNIGAYGVEAKDIIADIRAYDRETGSFVNIDPATCGYGYRTSNFKTIWKGRYIITAVTYRLSRTPQPKLDYGGLRKVLEDRGVAVPSSGTCAPPHMGRGRGPFPKEMGGAGVERSGTEFPEEGTATPLSAQIIRDAIIDIRRKKLPAVEEIGSAGSFFCNPVISHEHFERIVAIAKEDNGPEYAVPHYDAPGGKKVPAAWMIEQCGFKGRRNGGAQVYQNQPLVIVNASGTATPEDIIGLEQEVIKAIQTKYGITLHPEVEHI